MKNRAWTGLGSVAVCGALLATSPPATAQTPPNYGFEWATITHPGNRNANALEAPRFHRLNPPYLVGGVDYVYRIAKGQVTVEQLLEFVKAYSPFHDNQAYSRISGEFTGNFIFATNRDPTQPPGWILEPGSEKYETDMSWHFAARYANWLHNGKVNEKWAFEKGAYDTSTFFDNPNGSFNDQITHNPEARFWIPSMSELIKANHYDPDRYGPGEEGYWKFNSTSDVRLIGGPPGSPGAQTDNGSWGNSFQHYPFDAYPDTVSPWGLLGASGGTRQWTEGVEDFGFGPVNRRVRGTRRHFSLGHDNLDRLAFRKPDSFFSLGLRLASAVPSPATFVLLGTASLFLVSRRRRK